MNLEIRLGEYLEGDSIFGRIQSLSPFPFFDQMNALDMDKHLNIFYGERLVYHKFIKLDIESVAKLIVGLYSDKWEKMISINEIDFLAGSEKTINEVTDSNRIDTGSNTRTHKVSAFNSEELINDNSDIDSSTNTTDNNGNRLLTEKTKSLQNAFNNLQLSKKLNIIEAVVKDVSDYLTLNVY